MNGAEERAVSGLLKSQSFGINLVAGGGGGYRGAGDDSV
jgi:hypothetical protein